MREKPTQFNGQQVVSDDTKGRIELRPGDTFEQASGHSRYEGSRNGLNVTGDRSYGGRKPGQMTAGAQSRGSLGACHWTIQLWSWLPILLQLMLTQTPIILSNCDDGFQMEHPFDITQELDDQLSSQMEQQKSIDYLIHQASSGVEPMTGSEESHANDIGAEYSDADSLFDSSFARDSQAQQHQQFLNDLLESQSSDPSPAAASAPNSTDTTTTTWEQTSQVIGPTPFANSSSSSSSSGSGSSVLKSPTIVQASQQVVQPDTKRPPKSPSVSSLLSQLTGQSSQSTNYEALITGLVSNSILNPIRSQTAAVGNKVRKTILAASNQQHQLQQQQQQQASEQIASSSSRPQSVGQSIDGNIEYDSNQNAINGFIEFPSLGFVNNSQKLTMAALKPLVFAALKTVPIKLGSVGWKLLQLIAWKKIYKTHHPSSGEFEVEQEIRQRDPAQSGQFAYGGRMVDSESVIRPHKSSKMGRSYSAMRDPSAAASTPIMMNANYAFGGPNGWPFVAAGSMDAAAAAAAPLFRGSMGHHHQHLYSRHLVPGHMSGSSSSPSSSHPAMVAAATAAAAAALQAQWAQQHSLQHSHSAGDSENQLQQQSAGKPNGSSMRGIVVHQKRGSLGGNWFVSPAQAYATALQAALSQQQRQQQQQQPDQPNQNNQGPSSRLGRGGRGSSRSQGLEQVGLQPISSSQYQNLFDNAAAVAVQNAVKLPQDSGNSGDLLDQTDSLTGSSLSLDENSMADSEGWSDESSLQRSSFQQASNRLSDSLLGLNGADGSSGGKDSLDFDDSPLDSALTSDRSHFGRRLMFGQY